LTTWRLDDLTGIEQIGNHFEQFNQLSWSIEQ